MTAYARANDAALLGWHRHGPFWVEGIVAADDCALCDAAETHWRRQESAQADADPSLAAVRARRAALLGTPAKPIVAVVPSLDLIRVHEATDDAQIPVEQAEIVFAHTQAHLVPDNEVVEPEPPPPAPIQTFVLTPPTAESIRRHRQRKPIR